MSATPFRMFDCQRCATNDRVIMRWWIHRNSGRNFQQRELSLSDAEFLMLRQSVLSVQVRDGEEVA